MRGPVPCILYDGQTAAGHKVTVEPAVDGRGLVVAQGGAATVWPLDRLRLVSGDKARMVLTLHVDGSDEQSRDPARLVVTDADLLAWVRAGAPSLTQVDVPAGTFARVAIRVGGAVVALALILLVFLPTIADRLADGLTREREIAFGEAVVGQIEALLASSTAADLVCKSPGGVAALEKLRLKLVTGQALSYDIKLRVFDHEMVNAFAVPGGQVVILRGFLDQAESPAELAGVLGHEIGHVEARDPTRLAFRAAGSAGILSLIFGDLSGGLVLGFASNQLLSASYTREAEARADEFAYGLMERTGVGTAGLAAFFARIDGMDGEVPEYLSTHPASQNRAEAARLADKGARTVLLTEAEWRDLKAICKR